MSREQIAIIGGGPAGLAAAMAAAEAGAEDIVLLERDRELGGILNQCVHDGFGNIVFGETLTGPEYARRYVEQLRRRPGIRALTGTMALQLNPDRVIKAVNRAGVFELKPAAVVLAMGCRERSRFQAVLPGYRPAGVYTAGAVQRLINMEGLMPGEQAVILGSGDIGMIVARRLTLEGARVCGVFEIQPRPGGLTRNVVQCLQDFEIPLFLSHTITFIHGKKRINGVSVAPVDSRGKPHLDQERFIPCDTLILSVGLIPENELSRRAGVIIDQLTGGPQVDQDMATSISGIFAAGNVVQVHDLVDHVSAAAVVAGWAAARFTAGNKSDSRYLKILRGENVAAIVPQHLSLPLPENDRIDLYLRVNREIRNAAVTLLNRDQVIYSEKVRKARPPEMIHFQIQTSLLKAPGNIKEIRCRVEAEGMRES